MKFTSKPITQPKEILANDHFVAIEYDCSALEATDGVIKAGTVVPANNASAIGVLLYDVYPDENPNGAVVIHGFVTKSKMPVEPAAEAITALKGVTFMPVAE